MQQSPRSKGWQRGGQQSEQALVDYTPKAAEKHIWGAKVAGNLSNWGTNTDKLDLELIAGVVTHICRCA